MAFTPPNTFSPAPARQSPASVFEDMAFAHSAQAAGGAHSPIPHEQAQVNGRSPFNSSLPIAEPGMGGGGGWGGRAEGGYRAAGQEGQVASYSAFSNGAPLTPSYATATPRMNPYPQPSPSPSPFTPDFQGHHRAPSSASSVQAPSPYLGPSSPSAHSHASPGPASLVDEPLPMEDDFASMELHHPHCSSSPGQASYLTDRDARQGGGVQRYDTLTWAKENNARQDTLTMMGCNSNGGMGSYPAPRRETVNVPGSGGMRPKVSVTSLTQDIEDQQIQAHEAAQREREEAEEAAKRKAEAARFGDAPLVSSPTSSPRASAALPGSSSAVIIPSIALPPARRESSGATSSLSPSLKLDMNYPALTAGPCISLTSATPLTARPGKERSGTLEFERMLEELARGRDADSSTSGEASGPEQVGLQWTDPRNGKLRIRQRSKSDSCSSNNNLLASLGFGSLVPSLPNSAAGDVISLLPAVQAQEAHQGLAPGTQQPPPPPMSVYGPNAGLLSGAAPYPSWETWQPMAGVSGPGPHHQSQHLQHGMVDPRMAGIFSSRWSPDFSAYQQPTVGPSNESREGTLSPGPPVRRTPGGYDQGGGVFRPDVTVGPVGAGMGIRRPLSAGHGHRRGQSDGAILSGQDFRSQYTINGMLAAPTTSAGGGVFSGPGPSGAPDLWGNPPYGTAHPSAYPGYGSPHFTASSPSALSAASGSIGGYGSGHSRERSWSHSSIGSAVGSDLGGGAVPRPIDFQSKTTAATKAAAARRRKEGTQARYVCEMCGETFTRLYNKRGHERAHRGEKPFACGYPGCDKSFARQHDRKRHNKLHSGVKDYSCQACGKSFIRLDALQRHLRADAGQACFLRLKALGILLPAGLEDLMGGKSSNDASEAF